MEHQVANSKTLRRIFPEKINAAVLAKNLMNMCHIAAWH